MARVLRSILKEMGIFSWKVSDCEELVGVTHRRWWGGWLSPKIQYKSAQIVCSRTTHARQI